MKCTWEGCKSKATVDHKDKDGKIWARTCKKHQAQLEDSIKNSKAKSTLGIWIKMHGGSKKFAKEMAGKMVKDPKFKQLMSILYGGKYEKLDIQNKRG